MAGQGGISGGEALRRALASGAGSEAQQRELGKRAAACCGLRKSRPTLHAHLTASTAAVPTGATCASSSGWLICGHSALAGALPWAMAATASPKFAGRAAGRRGSMCRSAWKRRTAAGTCAQAGGDGGDEGDGWRRAGGRDSVQQRCFPDPACVLKRRRAQPWLRRALTARLRHLQEVGQAVGHGVVVKVGDVEDEVGGALKGQHCVAASAGRQGVGRSTA